MAITEFNAAVNQIATERGISVESVIESIESALISAYKKDYGENVENDSEEEAALEEESLTAELDPLTGEAKVFKDGKDVTPSGFGRIAAQTAKQVIYQKIRETEKDVVLGEYEDKVGEIVNGHIFRIENNVIVIDLGKAHGILLPNEQIPDEEYRVNQRLKAVVRGVRDSGKGPEVMVSRAAPEFVTKLFEQEVPEIASEVVVIEAIAREPGSRTKMAVSSNDERIDPVGSCVGQKGVRVQSVIAELNGEKIDIVPFSEDSAKFIASALSPARVTDVALDRENKVATVSVPEDQQSLAIGKAGQNARLANKLTDWKIDIKGAADFFDEETGEAKESEVQGGIWDELIQKVEDDEEKENAEDESVSESGTTAEEETETKETQEEEKENEETTETSENE
ncbi:transcription termination/antitermination protein NusA [candidate division WWE3 bacterium]|nr:transcription termination/antitermination protein NusA [candidate division WWE3 bacterium]